MFWRILCFSSLLFLSKLAHSVPLALLMPWYLPGISYDEQQKNQQVLGQSWNALKEQYIPSSQLLYQFEAQLAREFTLNQRRKAENFAYSQEIDVPIWREGVILQPLLCPFDQSWILGLTLHSWPRGELLAIRSQRLGAEVSSSKLLVREQISESLGIMLESLKTIDKPKTEALSFQKLKILTDQEGDKKQIGVLACASLLSAEKLIAISPIAQVFDSDSYNFVRQLLEIKDPVIRANRIVHMNWAGSLANSQQGYQISTRLSEAVYGKSISKNKIIDVSWQEKLTFPDTFLEEITELSKSLQKQDMPMVSHIDRAWIYLDRGRAWGLEIKDRMLSKESKGHIVKFYGPEMNLSSPRGFPVSEGAILYIRKGQKDVKIGDIFEFDSKIYPTPWPPQKTSD